MKTMVSQNLTPEKYMSVVLDAFKSTNEKDVKELSQKIRSFLQDQRVSAGLMIATLHLLVTGSVEVVLQGQPEGMGLVKQ